MFKIEVKWHIWNQIHDVKFWKLNSFGHDYVLKNTKLIRNLSTYTKWGNVTQL